MVMEAEIRRWWESRGGKCQTSSHERGHFFLRTFMSQDGRTLQTWAIGYKDKPRSPECSPSWPSYNQCDSGPLPSQVVRQPEGEAVIHCGTGASPSTRWKATMVCTGSSSPGADPRVSQNLVIQSRVHGQQDGEYPEDWQEFTISDPACPRPSESQSALWQDPPGDSHPHQNLRSAILEHIFSHGFQTLLVLRFKSGNLSDSTFIAKAKDLREHS